MIKGTTPTFVLELTNQEIDLTEAQNVYVSFEQGTVNLEKKTGNSGVTVEAHRVLVYLTQAESLQFVANKSIKCQINWTYSDGSRAATTQKSISIGPNLINRVID